MARSKRKAELPPEVEVIGPNEDIGTEVTLSSRPASLIELVDRGQTNLIPTDRLVPFYVQADAVAKRIEDLKKKAKAGIILRREEGEVSGDQNQHRKFEFNTPLGRCELTVQEKRSWRPNPEKLESLLKAKNLWDSAVDLVVSTSGDEFQKFLWKHRKELRGMGLVFTEQVNMEKVDGLCKAKLITEAELESILEKPEPAYALIAKLR